MELGLKGAAVCVSGGTKGLGRQAAIAFAREGARVAVAARGAPALQETVALLREAGASDVLGVQTDVGKLDSINALFETIDARWGELNTLINMPGATEPSAGQNFVEVPDEQWQFYFDVGIMSVVRCTRAAVPLMRRAGWGRVINISSIASSITVPMQAPYTMAKAALQGLSKNMAWALAPEGILVNTVTPGVFRTEGTRDFMRATGVADRYDPDSLSDIWNWMRETNGRRHAGVIGRVALPEELAPVLVLLGSRANSYIVGANISVDGGTDFSRP
ncbi:MAG TPA: SDR family oxidoreductase [Steroidobacteraceae bacterium]|nr:SDR family oxidoreductase [Steroidobacteraceae bacterium]